MIWKVTLIAAAAGLVSTGTANARTPVDPTSAKPARQCFWTHQVTNFASSDSRIVNLRVGVKDIYQLEMFGRCNDVDWSQKIAVVSRGGSNICSGLDAEIIAPSTIGPQRCPVRSVRKLTVEEVKALPDRARP